MNIAKNMELIFVAVVALSGAASFAHAAVPVHHAATPAAVAALAFTGQMPVVHITAKRLTAAEKLQLAQ